MADNKLIFPPSGGRLRAAAPAPAASPSSRGPPPPAAQRTGRGLAAPRSLPYGPRSPPSPSAPRRTGIAAAARGPRRKLSALCSGPRYLSLFPLPQARPGRSRRRSHTPPARRGVRGRAGLRSGRLRARPGPVSPHGARRRAGSLGPGLPFPLSCDSCLARGRPGAARSGPLRSGRAPLGAPASRPRSSLGSAARGARSFTPCQRRSLQKLPGCERCQALLMARVSQIRRRACRVPLEPR